jgi:WD40 repeat protein
MRVVQAGQDTSLGQIGFDIFWLTHPIVVRNLDRHVSSQLIVADAVSSVAFSPDVKRLVSGSSDKTLKVWDAQTGQESLSLKGHTGSVTSLAYSPDGKRIR